MHSTFIDATLHILNLCRTRSRIEWKKKQILKKEKKDTYQRFVNLFQEDAKVALDGFKTNSEDVISEVNKIKSSLTTEINGVKENIISLENKEKLLQTKLDEILNSTNKCNF